MLAEAQQAGDAYNQAVQGAENDPFAAALPWEVRDKVNTFHIIPQYRESVQSLLIPQFFQVIPQSLFTDGDKVLLSKEMLADGFTLKGKAYDIDFAAADDEIIKVDVETGRSVPRAYQMESAEQRYFKEYFSSLPPESRVRQCKDMMIRQLDKLKYGGWGRLARLCQSYCGWNGSGTACRYGKSSAGLRRKNSRQNREPFGAALQGDFLHMA